MLANESVLSNQPGAGNFGKNLAKADLMDYLASLLGV